MPGKVSTVVQFRAIDYGMENCSLALAPAPSAEGAAAADVELDVWALADARRRPGQGLNANLDVRTLTWASRPARREHIGTLSVVGGAPGETRMFACPSGSYHTLEIACATTGGCDVDILGIGHGQSGAFFPPFFFRLSRRICTDPRACPAFSSHRALREAVSDVIVPLSAPQILLCSSITVFAIISM